MRPFAYGHCGRDGLTGLQQIPCCRDECDHFIKNEGNEEKEARLIPFCMVAEVNNRLYLCSHVELTKNLRCVYDMELKR